MKKSRNARNLKRRVKTRKVMRGGEMNEPVNKDVIDALKKVVDSMKADGKYPKLNESLENLIMVVSKNDAAPPPVNDTSSTVNADADTVNAPPPVNTESTVNIVPPTVNAVPPVNDTNEPNTELTEKSVIHYGNYGKNGKQPSLYYSEIKQRLQKMIDNPNTMNPGNIIPIETLQSRVKEITNAKNKTEVNAILQKYKFSDTYSPGRPAFLRFAMTGGGSRKHKMRRIKNQYTSK